MQIQMRCLLGCSLALTQKRALVVPDLISTPRTLSGSPLQYLGATTFFPDSRRHRNIWLAAHKGEFSFATTTRSTTRSKRSSSGNEGSAPLPAHADDILMVPSAHLHVKQLERHDIFTLSDFRWAYNKEKANFRCFLQDKIEVRDEEQLNAMEAFFCAMEDFRATSASASPAGANQIGPKASMGSRAGPVEPIAMLGMTSEQVTLSVEGNISAGKSTFLSILKRHLLTDTGFSFVKEPIEQWQNVGGSSVNLLDLFYRDPARMAYTFQNFVFLTRVLQERETYGSTDKARILERSVFSDRMVFVRAVHASCDLADHELAIYDAWFGPILASLPTLVPNGLIYLRASPETCMARLKKRARSEEGGIPIAYLQCLHANHEDWLLDAATRACELKQQLLLQRHAEEARVATTARKRPSYEASTSCSADLDVDLIGINRQQRERQQLPSLGALRPLAEAPPEALGMVEIPDSLADSLHIIDATKVSGVPSAGFLHQLPTLVVDCDADVDVDRDTAYGNKISNLICDYTTFVSQYRAACHRLVLEHHTTAACEWGSGSGLDAAVKVLPHRGTDYYTTDDIGRVTYRSVVRQRRHGCGDGSGNVGITAAAFKVRTMNRDGK
ncbi:hypothetical protein VaNZ11_012080 [Volvox africanus]|uniref:Deoxynucleoside kinase domain-containing protein n=1 Tax=Volvox africanus TaxID=51714 RepID=A0ABQ5SDQ9_9CHLO|nr:hypothetical protein VaNZ11_012080 [Volvox africanus]